MVQKGDTTTVAATGAQASGASDYVVLARKYRPRNFEELYGQGALVRTLTNAIKAGKIHHAYVLTGIRGVGKTTTARIIAKALNCEDGPATTWSEDDPQVKAISIGNHVDVLEFDAASNRGVEDVAKLFEGVAYAPVMGRHKVYIIDEVHMLSPHAFNSLLKTLEEPPAGVKFIFATTEVNKIPVTVLSRCQRFDLKRIPSETLMTLFADILQKEDIKADPAAVAMVARAADGSARDGLSLLDQAIALSHGEEISTALVQDMLGLADTARLYDLLEKTLDSDAPAALAVLDELYARGQDALGLVRGLLEIVHMITRLQVVPGLKTADTLTEIERTRAVPLASKVGRASLSRLYQLLTHAAVEVREAERPYETLSMGVVRLAYLAPLPPMEKLLADAQAVVEQGNVQAVGASAGAQAVHAPVEETPPTVAVVEQPVATSPVKDAAAPPAADRPTDWSGLVRMMKAHKPALAAALGQQVRCVEMNGAELAVQVDKGLHDAKDLIRDLRLALRDITGEGWLIDHRLGDVVVPTLAEEAREEEAGKKAAAAEDPSVKDVLEMFPGAELEDIKLNEGASA